MTGTTAPLVAALLAGLLGSAHCLGMCGGISGLFAMRSSAAGLRQQLPLAMAYNAGRLGSYATLGFAVAFLGSHFTGLAPTLAGPVRIAAALIIVLILSLIHI